MLASFIEGSYLFSSHMKAYIHISSSCYELCLLKLIFESPNIFSNSSTHCKQLTKHISQWWPAIVANIVMLISPPQFVRFMSSQMCFVCLNYFGSGSFCFMWSFCVVMCFVCLCGKFCKFRVLPRIMKEICSYPLGDAEISKQIRQPN